jgi:hypothetical protein
MNSPPAEIGAQVADIETPALVIDLNAFERNIAKMRKKLRRARTPARQDPQVDRVGRLYRLR